ncbi:MAG: FKBP-type peptidyl-prolyl cis-trans isomerase [Bacteroidaceae bacterium]|nr:FKBP-type peptidyl-prolyl cis-trans isomerase [Bacteroidaceae bacterium]MDE7165410.1 FKBP-type peptidyl-prolyl cis-trans isomerase [Bacteroidaceae bacterium]
MKKLSFFFAVAIAAVIASCGNGTPKADLKSDIDTLSYVRGLTMTQGLHQYLEQMGVDSTQMNEFIKGLNEGVNAGDDQKKSAYYIGVQIGQQISQQMIKGINYEIFGEDSTQTISLKNFMAGFVCGTLQEDGIMTMDEANLYAREKQSEIKAEQMAKLYGPWKEENEAFMSKLAKKAGVQKLDNGVYYEIIEEGNGEIPADTSRVKVHYEGRLINDTIFDSSYRRNEPTTFRCNQVIPGWTNALTHMPAGSKWKVYIPQEQAYGDREAGQIKPFSALVFTIELLSIEK